MHGTAKWNTNGTAVTIDMRAYPKYFILAKSNSEATAEISNELTPIAYQETDPNCK
jgi:hypothetical protein